MDNVICVLVEASIALGCGGHVDETMWTCCFKEIARMGVPPGSVQLSWPRPKNVPGNVHELGATFDQLPCNQRAIAEQRTAIAITKVIRN